MADTQAPNTIITVNESVEFDKSESAVETYSVEKDGILYVTLPYCYSTPFAINSIPYAQINWFIDTENGRESHPAGFVWEVPSDGYELTDGTYYVKQSIERGFNSYLAIVVFTDNDGNAYPEYKDDGTVHPLHPICIESMDYVPTTPAVMSNSEDFPPPVQTAPGSNKKVIFTGWGDANTGVIYGEKSPLTLRPRTLLILKPIWKEVYADGRRATLVFRAGLRGSFYNSDGKTVLESWTQKDDTYSLSFSNNTSDSDMPYGEYAELGLKTLSFTIPQGLRYVPYDSSENSPDKNFEGYIGHEGGKDSIPRMILAWVRVDGGTLVHPVNDTNHGFILSNSEALDKRGVPEGDGYSDIFYPGDRITLDEDETAVLKPIWTYEYRYHIVFDLSQFYDLTDDTPYEDTEVSERAYFYAQLKYWVERNNLTPIYIDGAIKKAYLDVSSPKSTYWMRIPPYMPPCSTYFEAWVANKPMCDITGQKIYGDTGENNVVMLNPCPGQRVGFVIEDGKYEYNCTFTAKWGSKTSSTPYIPLVYDDPEWAEPKISTVVGSKSINDNEIDMPLSRMAKGMEYASPNGDIVLSFEITLDGTGRQNGNFIDIRPRGKGFNTIVKSFDHWNLRVDNTGTEQKFLAGDKIRIIFEGNVMAGYYWGDFPGPYSEHTVPKTISPAWKFFKTDEGIANGDPVYWQDVIFKKAIWGPQAQPRAEGGYTDIRVLSLPEVIFANASWRTQTGAYLIFGDYTNQDFNSSSGILPALELPCIQTVQDAISNNLSEISTVTYGYENNFIMDLGTVRSFSLKISRINPADYNDSYSVYDDPNFSRETDENGNEIWYQNGAIVTDTSQLPQFENEFYYADHWSNSKWYYKLREKLNFWQNSVGQNRYSQYGGVQFFYSVPPINIAESDLITISDDASALRPFYPNMLYNVFVTGSISPTYDGQKMTLSLPLTLSKMVTTSKTEASEKKTCCVFRPYDDNYRIGERKLDKDSRWYMDSIIATDVLRATYRTSDTDWVITTPTSLSEWSGTRHFYSSQDSETPVESSTLAVYQWKVQWYKDGVLQTKDVFAGESIDVGNANGVMMTAVWVDAIESILMVADDGYVWRVNHMDNNRNSVYSLNSNNDRVPCFPIPQGVSRFKIVMCGGGGAGGRIYIKMSGNKYYTYGGGGGAGGEKIEICGSIRDTDEVIAVYAGHGGARVNEDSVDGEKSFVAIGSKQQFERSTRLNASNFDNVFSFSRTTPLYYTTVYSARGGQGGQNGPDGLGGMYATDVLNVANGGDQSYNLKEPGRDGGSIGSFKGGIGGKSISGPYSYYFGGGGGGASSLELYVPYKVIQNKYSLPYLKLEETAFLSKGGNGYNMGHSGGDGEYGGGGGGGGRTSSKRNKRARGGSGVVYVQLFAGGKN